jgi:tRNA(Ile)-lysidine synthase
MIHIVGEVPREITVACSGGADSMAVLDFLRRSHKVTAAYFNHGSSHAIEAEELVRQYCLEHDLECVRGFIQQPKDKKLSLEEFWRNERYRFFSTLGEVVTGHNLGDVVEWWLMSSAHGEAKLIPFRNKNVFRPFLTTTKEEFETWCQRKSVPFIEDPSNQDQKFARNLMRKKIVPLMKIVNPGIEKVLKKKLLSRDNP